MNIAIISGASSGIGLEIAKELDKLSLDELWLISSNKDKLFSASKNLSTKARILPFDLSNEAYIYSLTSLLKDINPSVKFLVCSAGVGFNGAFEELTCENIAKMIDINVRALTSLTHTVLPNVSKDGRIIEIASSAGFMPQPYFSVYSATKSYVISFSRALRAELKKKKIYVTAVCPGPVETPFFTGLDNVKEYKKKYAISPQKVAKGAIKASKRKKALFVPTFSMKMVRLASKIIPTSMMLKFYK